MVPMHTIRKQIIDHLTKGDANIEGVLDLPRLARFELTSEDPDHPMEAALTGSPQSGWRAAQPGKQTIRLLFDEPQTVRRIHLSFHEDEHPRTQEFVVRWSSDNGESYSDLVRQQYTFSNGTSDETETYNVNLVHVTALELSIIPDISGGDARASLWQLRIT